VVTCEAQNHVFEKARMHRIIHPDHTSTAIAVFTFGKVVYYLLSGEGANLHLRTPNR
jgi:vancomycin permeability regulator SanA